MTWVELNQLAPQTHQMDNRHHQDTIIDHHSHWNWMKTLNMGMPTSAFLLICLLIFGLEVSSFLMTSFTQEIFLIKSMLHLRFYVRSMQIRFLSGIL
jgi:hypothetical protein